MIPLLPAEIVINVFANLDIRQIHQAQLVCRRWNGFVKLNESSLYHGAAILHHFVPPETPLPFVRKIYPGPWLDGMKGWKDLCQRWFRLERSWEGRDPKAPIIKMMPCTGTDVHRFKLDEEIRLVVTTHRNGGLRVSCMDQGVLLFEMSREYVRRLSHCEYGNGYLIFDRIRPHGVEVWRLKTDDWDGSIPTLPPTRSMPNEAMVTAYPDHVRCLADNTDRRGVFLPWAFLLPPHDPCAYRFVYPTLLLGSVAGGEVYLYDIPSATLIQTIALPRNESTLFTDEEGNSEIRILYVELSPRHVFVCTMTSVVILSRATNPSGAHTVVDFPREDPGLRHPRIVRTYAARLRYRCDTRTRELATYHLDQPIEPTTSTAIIPFDDQPQEFIGVHASQDGRHFAAVTWYGNMYIVPDFERVLRGEKSFSDITLRINLEGSALNIAFEHGRVCVQTLKGIYVFDLDRSYHNVIQRPIVDPYPHPRTFPNLTVNQLEFARNRVALQLVSCLKMTKSSIWLDWSEHALSEARAGQVWANADPNLLMDANALDRFALRTICCVDFAPERSSNEVTANEGTRSPTTQNQQH